MTAKTPLVEKEEKKWLSVLPSCMQNKKVTAFIERSLDKDMQLIHTICVEGEKDGTLYGCRRILIECEWQSEGYKKGVRKGLRQMFIDIVCGEVL